MALIADKDENYWAIVELMGHVRMAGRVSEVERFGAKMGRIDIPDGEGFKTQFFSGGSIYRETPCSEATARVVAARNMPEPVHSWELLPPARTTSSAPAIDPNEDDTADWDEPEEDADDR